MIHDLSYYLNHRIEQRDKDAFIASRTIHVDTRQWIKTAENLQQLLAAIKKVHGLAMKSPLSEHEKLLATTIIEELKTFCCTLLIVWGGPAASAPMVLDQLIRMSG
ncbi:hypothetical protein CVT24_011367 [Panaeolus cyanescens]|uniref:Uncharacterized protein n=1 Tax=Panaeolus cyanescens TaxID=181874 RepID=A0A409YGN6_9AGAR|nr:hypothetical protein CVT24_011367 [Panaeolus cyanescens]